MPIIYHITTLPEWDQARENGAYEAASLKEEGFIHCAQENQVAGVLERYFAGKTNLIKLTIDTEKLTSNLVYDWSPSTQDTFPHIYGALNLDAVITTERLN